MTGILLNPVGQVLNAIEEPEDMPPGGVDSTIEIFPEFYDALLHIESNSHLWVLSWFHKSARDVLQAVPGRVNPDLPLYGVFSLRSPNRPNPIGLSLTRLEKQEGRFLLVKGLDALNHTRVLDVKPYVENDCVFSPQTPYLKAMSREARFFYLSRLARAHHQEECPDFNLAVRMALIAEEFLGQLNSSLVLLEVKGSPCLADCLQGISRARFSNPPRFIFHPDSGPAESTWRRQDRWIKIKARYAWQDAARPENDDELFEIARSPFV